jgi:hypothetical protein
MKPTLVTLLDTLQVDPYIDAIAGELRDVPEAASELDAIENSLDSTMQEVYTMHRQCLQLEEQLRQRRDSGSNSAEQRYREHLRVCPPNLAVHVIAYLADTDIWYFVPKFDFMY